MKKGLMLGVVSILAMVSLESMLKDSKMAEQQVPSLQANLLTDTPVEPVEPALIITQVEPDQPTPIPSATDTTEYSDLEPVIELIGSTQVIIPTETSVPTRYVLPPTLTPEPTLDGNHLAELIGGYYCYGIEYGLFASWGQVFLKENGAIETIRYYGQSDYGEWRYDENSERIIFSPDTFFLDYGDVDWSDKELRISFHPWATEYMAHAEGGRMTCSPQ